MLISQCFNPETKDLETFIEHFEQADTTDNISVAKLSATYEDRYTKIKKRRYKFKEREENGNNCCNKSSSLYFSLHGENKMYTSRECNVLKKRLIDKGNPIYRKTDYKNKFKELNLLEAEASHQRAKHLKYKKLNKYFAKKKTPKEETVIIDDTLDINSSSSSED